MVEPIFSSIADVDLLAQAHTACRDGAASSLHSEDLPVVRLAKRLGPVGIHLSVWCGNRCIDVHEERLITSKFDCGLAQLSVDLANVGQRRVGKFGVVV